MRGYVWWSGGLIMGGFVWTLCSDVGDLACFVWFCLTWDYGSQPLAWVGVTSSLAFVGIWYFIFIMIVNLLAGLWGCYSGCVSVGSGSLFYILFLCRIMDMAYCMAITLISLNCVLDVYLERIVFPTYTLTIYPQPKHIKPLTSYIFLFPSYAPHTPKQIHAFPISTPSQNTPQNKHDHKSPHFPLHIPRPTLLLQAPSIHINCTFFYTPPKHLKISSGSTSIPFLKSPPNNQNNIHNNLF